MSSILRCLWICLFATVLLALLLGIFVLHLTTLPVHTPGKKVRVHIQPGQSFAQITDLLARKEVIRDPLLFQAVAMATGMSTRIQAGEFDINSGWTRVRILRTLTSGSEVVYTLSIPEGLTCWETGRLVGKSGLTSARALHRAVHDPKLLAEFHIPAASAEGYLFPETYILPRPQQGNAEPILRMMLDQFRTQISTHIWPGTLPNPQRIHRLVTLASLVEKETSLARERRRVAGVYVNRLQRGMRLQCDPTVIYGLGKDFSGNLTKKDLKDSENLYNTYRHSGLPPGPICSPGLASLQAAADPEEHDYLYFVSKGNGSHHFSRSLREHNLAVRRYQLR